MANIYQQQLLQQQKGQNSMFKDISPENKSDGSFGNYFGVEKQNLVLTYSEF
jgi:hypothetical protein